MLMITDTGGVIAVGGIMGGADTAVSEHTRDVLLESAFFAPEAIAGRARRYGLHTDSSHRFERGVDPQLQVLAIDRATELILEICGGDVGPVTEVTTSDIKEYWFKRISYIPQSSMSSLNPVVRIRKQFVDFLNAEQRKANVLEEIRDPGCRFLTRAALRLASVDDVCRGQQEDGLAALEAGRHQVGVGVDAGEQRPVVGPLAPVPVRHGLVQTVADLQRPGPRGEAGAGWLLASYHPSQQNTSTGRLTESMLDDVFILARRIIEADTIPPDIDCEEIVT